MGSICFLVLKLAEAVDTPFDWPFMCLLISLDSIVFVSLLRYSARRR